MQYSNQSVRRQDRLLDHENAQGLLMQGEYGVLSLQSDDGGAYGLPISYVWDGHKSIYLHCAPEGRKLNCLATNNKVSFCVVGRTQIIPEKFTTAYESIILSGTAHMQLPDDEKMKALSLLIDKYSPNDKAAGMVYAEKALAKTLVVRLDIEEWSGKTRLVN